MSDRRPSNPRPLFAGCPTHPEHADRKHDYMGNMSNYGDPCSFQIEPATVDDAIAHVRRGVESGTIKGEVREAWWLNENPEIGEDVWALPVEKPGTYVVIGPVSDGGSET